MSTRYAHPLRVDSGSISVALKPADRHVDGVVEMMLDATQKYQNPLTKKRLLGWHAALFPTGHSGMQKIRVGNWRDDSSGPMQVVSGPIGKERVHYQRRRRSGSRPRCRSFWSGSTGRARTIPWSKPRWPISGS